MTFTRVHPKAGTHEELGQKIVNWSLDKCTLPNLDADGYVADLAEFKKEIIE